MAEWTNPWPKTPIGDRVTMHCLGCGKTGEFVIEEFKENCNEWFCRSVHCGGKLVSYQMLKAAPDGAGPAQTGQEKRDHINRQLLAIWESDAKSSSPTLRAHGEERLAAIRSGTEPRTLVDMDAARKAAPYR